MNNYRPTLPHSVYLNQILLCKSDNYLPLEDKEVKAQRRQVACHWLQRGRSRMRTQVSILNLNALLLDQAQGVSIIS